MNSEDVWNTCPKTGLRQFHGFFSCMCILERLGLFNVCRWKKNYSMFPACQEAPFLQLNFIYIHAHILLIYYIYTQSVCIYH